MDRRALIEQPVPLVLTKMAGGMLIGFVAMAAFNITDTYFVAQLGTAELAAMSFTFPVAMFIGGLSIGIGIGASAMLSKKIGQGRHHEVQRLTTDALLFGLTLVVLLSTVGFFTIRPLFTLLGATAETLPLVEDYMRIWYLGMVFLVVPMIGNNAIRATGDTLWPSAIMVVDLVLNIILDPLLIFGLGPFPAWGIKGAAVATVFSRALALLASLYVLRWRKDLLALELPGVTRLLQSWKKILYFGIPTAGAHILMPIAYALVLRMVAWSGTEAVAAFGAGQRVEMLSVMPIMALGASLVPFVGQNLGAKNAARIDAAQKLATRFALGWGLFCAAVLLLVARPVAGIFSEDPTVIGFLTLLLSIAPFSFGFKGIAHTAGASMVGFGKPYHTTLAVIFRLGALMLPLAALGAYLDGFRGLVIGLCTAEILAGLATSAWSRVLFEKHVRARLAQS